MDTPQPGTATCGDVWTCWEACGGDATCQDACYDQGDAEAQSLFDALMACAEANGCQNMQCILINCPGDANACWADM